MGDVSDGRLAVAVDVEDETMQGENPDPDEMKLDHLGSNRRGVDEKEIGVDNEGLGVSTEVEVKGTSHKTIITRVRPVSLGNPDSMGRETRIQRPNNRAQVVFQDEILKVCTRLKDECCAAVAPIHQVAVADRVVRSFGNSSGTLLQAFPRTVVLHGGACVLLLQGWAVPVHGVRLGSLPRSGGVDGVRLPLCMARRRLRGGWEQRRMAPRRQEL